MPGRGRWHGRHGNAITSMAPADTGSLCQGMPGTSAQRPSSQCSECFRQEAAGSIRQVGRKKDQTPLAVAGSVHPFWTQPWAGTSHCTAGTWVCSLGSPSSSNSAAGVCRGAALALPAPRATVPSAEPTYLQVVEGETTFPSLLSPVLAAELVKQEKAVQMESLQHVHCLEQLQDREVSGGSGERERGPVRGRMETSILPSGERILAVTRRTWGSSPRHPCGPRHAASWVHLLHPPLVKRDWGDLQHDGNAAEQLLPSREGQEGR